MRIAYPLSAVSFLVALFSIAPTAVLAQGQASQHVVLVVPDTTVEQPGDVGARAHTNHLILVRPNFTGTAPSGETPTSIPPVYSIPTTTNGTVAGGSHVIAIVDAYDYPTASNDLNVFSQTFGLPAPSFQKVYATGSKPSSSPRTCGWGQEAALDIEWAHAMAPNATIILVEAKSNSYSDLFYAVDVATKLVVNGGGGEVSMSWGGSEFSGETSYDSHFNNASYVVYFAATGDTGGHTIYPSASPYVVAAGGTTIHRDSNGNFTSETGWSGSGGGPSVYEQIPSYQGVISSIVGTKRGVPDFSFDADPNSGVSVYDSASCQGLSGWLVFGGTSVATPSLAGIVNTAGHFYQDSFQELGTIYTDYAGTNYGTDFRDITSGTAGSYSAGAGWDFVTGVGSNQGSNGK